MESCKVKIAPLPLFSSPRLVRPRELTVLLPGQKPGKPHIAVASLFSETAAVNDAVIAYWWSLETSCWAFLV